METQEYLKTIAEDIKTCVIATVDENGHPVTCVIDIMDHDEKGLYFLTGRGKGLYSRLMNNPHMAFTQMQGDINTEMLAISVRGYAEEVGPDRLQTLFEKNPFMYELYPDKSQWEAQGLTVFRISSGSCEWLLMGKDVFDRKIISFGK